MANDLAPARIVAMSNALDARGAPFLVFYLESAQWVPFLSPAKALYERFHLFIWFSRLGEDGRWQYPAGCALCSPASDEDPNKRPPWS